MDRRRADDTTSDAGRDLPHRRLARRQVEVMQPVKKIGNGSGRSWFSLNSPHRLNPLKVQRCPSLSNLVQIINRRLMRWPVEVFAPRAKKSVQAWCGIAHFRITGPGQVHAEEEVAT
jgi:hypothetical protein